MKAVKAVHQQLELEGWGQSIKQLLASLPPQESEPAALHEAGLLLDRFYIPTRNPNALALGVPGESVMSKRPSAMPSVSWNSYADVSAYNRRLEQALTEDARPALCDHSELLGVWLFGSRARGDFGARSEVDLLQLARSADRGRWTGPLTTGTCWSASPRHGPAGAHPRRNGCARRSTLLPAGLGRIPCSGHACERLWPSLPTVHWLATDRTTRQPTAGRPSARPVGCKDFNRDDDNCPVTRGGRMIACARNAPAHRVDQAGRGQQAAGTMFAKLSAAT